jgi:chromosome partitioning protein
MRTQGEWELFIVDCPPSAGILTTSALLLSHYVVIPVEANPLAVNGLHQMIETLSSLKRQDNGPAVLGIIACRTNSRRRIHRSFLGEIEDAFPGKLAPVIRENVAVAEAPHYGRPITLHAPRSIGAEDYRRAALWLLERLD